MCTPKNGIGPTGQAGSPEPLISHPYRVLNHLLRCTAAPQALAGVVLGNVNVSCGTEKLPGLGGGAETYMACRTVAGQWEIQMLLSTECSHSNWKPQTQLNSS